MLKDSQDLNWKKEWVPLQLVINYIHINNNTLFDLISDFYKSQLFEENIIKLTLILR